MEWKEVPYFPAQKSPHIPKDGIAVRCAKIRIKGGEQFVYCANIHIGSRLAKTLKLNTGTYARIAVARTQDGRGAIQMTFSGNPAGHPIRIAKNGSAMLNMSKHTTALMFNAPFNPFNIDAVVVSSSAQGQRIVVINCDPTALATTHDERNTQ